MKFISRIIGGYGSSKGKGLRYFNDLRMLKRNIEEEYFYVRKNHKEIGEDIRTLVKMEEWNWLKKGLMIMSINQLDSWLVLRKIALSITKTLQRVDPDFMSPAQIEDLLFILSLLRYQLLSSDHDKDIFDEIEPFTNKMREYLRKLCQGEIDQHFLFVCKKLLATYSDCFIDRREDIQSFVLQRKSQIKSMRLFLPQLLQKGCISNFWTEKFVGTMTSESIAKGYENELASLLFSSLNIPTTILQREEKTQIKVELDIINILEGYQYYTRPNMLINGFQVDILVGDNLVVEYNGHHHYVINSDQLVPTLKQKWKTKILNQRGFAVSSIPYSQFKAIKWFQDKRLYLVKKIQTDFLNHFAKNNIQQ